MCVCVCVCVCVLRLPKFVGVLFVGASVVILVFILQKHCDPTSTEPDILDCLKKAKDDDDFDDKCRRIVIQRQITQARGKQQLENCSVWPLKPSPHHWKTVHLVC